jgi:hypothetical protein
MTPNDGPVLLKLNKIHRNVSIQVIWPSSFCISPTHTLFTSQICEILITFLVSGCYYLSSSHILMNQCLEKGSNFSKVTQLELNS